MKLAALKQQPAARAPQTAAALPRTGPAPGQKIPDSEWQALSKLKPAGKPKCNFFNSSLGCKFGTACKLEHKCKQCGGDHPWIGNR